MHVTEATEAPSRRTIPRRTIPRQIKSRAFGIAGPVEPCDFERTGIDVRARSSAGSIEATGVLLFGSTGFRQRTDGRSRRACMVDARCGSPGGRTAADVAGRLEGTALRCLVRASGGSVDERAVVAIGRGTTRSIGGGGGGGALGRTARLGLAGLGSGFGAGLGSGASGGGAGAVATVVVVGSVGVCCGKPCATACEVASPSRQIPARTSVINPTFRERDGAASAPRLIVFAESRPGL